MFQLLTRLGHPALNEVEQRSLSRGLRGRWEAAFGRDDDLFHLIETISAIQGVGLSHEVRKGGRPRLPVRWCRSRALLGLGKPFGKEIRGDAGEQIVPEADDPGIVERPLDRI